jgi:hypothetical protein
VADCVRHWPSFCERKEHNCYSGGPAKTETGRSVILRKQDQARVLWTLIKVPMARCPTNPVLGASPKPYPSIPDGYLRS